MASMVANSAMGTKAIAPMTANTPDHTATRWSPVLPFAPMYTARRPKRPITATMVIHGMGATPGSGVVIREVDSKTGQVSVLVTIGHLADWNASRIQARRLALWFPRLSAAGIIVAGQLLSAFHAPKGCS